MGASIEKNNSDNQAQTSIDTRIQYQRFLESELGFIIAPQYVWAVIAEKIKGRFSKNT